MLLQMSRDRHKPDLVLRPEPRLPTWRRQTSATMDAMPLELLLTHLSWGQHFARLSVRMKMERVYCGYTGAPSATSDSLTPASPSAILPPMRSSCCRCNQ